jgi:curved DNA-binding protein CbpA
MAARSSDPYQMLGVSSDISDDQLRSAYRRLVQLHHPDHNGGSAESAQRFEEVQDAYARIKKLRDKTPRAGQAPPAGPAPPTPGADPDVEARLADLERELRDAHLARERARQAAREAAAESAARPSDEDLGYVTTDDSFSKILADARAQVSDRLSQTQEHPVTKRVADLIDELEDLASKLTRNRPG